jgi:hypothetical protein
MTFYQCYGSAFGSGSVGSVCFSQRYGFEDPDPHPDPNQNVTDPQHWINWMHIEEDKAIKTRLQEINMLFIIQYTPLYLNDVL